MLMKFVDRSARFGTYNEDQFIITDSGGDASGGRTTGGRYTFINPVTAEIESGSTTLDETRLQINKILITADSLGVTSFRRPRR